MMILKDNFLERKNIDKNRGTLVVSDLLFYAKRLIYCTNALLTNECKPNSSKNRSVEVPCILR